MARLAAAKCPTCGADVHIDPALAFATCRYCGATSFVHTRTRPVPLEIVERQAPVIDVREPSRAPWIAAVIVLGVLGVASTGAALFGTGSRAAGTALAPSPSGAPPPANTEESTPAKAEEPPVFTAPADGDADSTEPTAPERRVAEPTSSRSKTPSGRVTTGQVTVSGRLPHAAIRTVVGRNISRFRMCYEQGLTRSPALSGSVNVRFVVGRDGAVSNVSDGGSDLGDGGVKRCVLNAFSGLSFPAPEGGIVMVVYPLRFSPA